jgi:small subunit ribosomal protein S16
MGRKKKPFYRVVVKYTHKTSSSSFIEQLGFYDPFLNNSFSHKLFVLNKNRLIFWLSRGAYISLSLNKVLGKVGFFNIN